MMAESMPQLFAGPSACWMRARRLHSFFWNYLYGFLYIVFPMVLIVIAAAPGGLLGDTGGRRLPAGRPSRQSKIAATGAGTGRGTRGVCDVCLCLLCADGAGDVSGQLDMAAFLRLNAGLCLKWPLRACAFWPAAPSVMRAPPPVWAPGHVQYSFWCRCWQMWAMSSAGCKTARRWLLFDQQALLAGGLAQRQAVLC